jgi:hypothetical protein
VSLLSLDWDFVYRCAALPNGQEVSQNANFGATLSRLRAVFVMRQEKDEKENPTNTSRWNTLPALQRRPLCDDGPENRRR